MTMQIQGSTFIRLGEMIDQAIGSPEVGVVDFNMLQLILHVIVQQLHIGEKPVELRGSISQLPINREHSHTVNVKEYEVEQGPQGEIKSYKDIPAPTRTDSPLDTTILVAERVKVPGAGAGGAARGPGGGGPMPSGGGGGMQTVLDDTTGSCSTVLRTVSGNLSLAMVPVENFQRLVVRVKALEDKINGVPPTNAELIAGVRSQTNIKGITDMWATVNVQGRLDAAESGIAKLSSLVENIINDTPDLQRKVSSIYKKAAQAAPTAGALGAPGFGAGAVVYQVDAGAPGSQEAPGSQVAAGTPGAQGVVAGAPGVQVTATLQGGPGAPGDVAGAPGVQVAAVFPGAPGAPGAPGVQGAPVTLEYNAGAPGVQITATATFQGYVAGAISNAPVVPPAIEQFAKFLPVPPARGYKDMSSGDIGAVVDNVNDLRNDLNNLYCVFYRTMNDLGVDPSGGDVCPSSALAEYMVNSAEKAERTAALVAANTAPGQQVDIPGRAQVRRAGFIGLAGAGGAGGGAGGGGGGYDGSQDLKNLSNKLLNLQKKIEKCECVMDVQHSRMKEMIGTLEDQVISTMGKKGKDDVTDAVSKPKVQKSIKDLEGLADLAEIVIAMQKQLKELHDIALIHLAAEREDRKKILNGLIEQVEVLKSIKIDREDLASAMADKADLRMLARKVSHEQFEMACDDLAKGLQNAIGKLNLQESLWQQALDDIQRDIELKLNKMELIPVKEFFTNKLKQLQDNLKQLAQLHREVEAAGTKRKLMRDVNCISCDANAVMNMTAGPSIPGNKPVTALRSMKPYLTYELDAIRKSQAASAQQRNMLDWEQIDKQMGQSSKLQKVRSDTNKHICTRYCGGSHTVTTPAQRVARHGHFIKQWGPDVLPLSSVLAAGDDGKMYKVEVEPASGGPGGAVNQSTCTPSKDDKKRPSDAKPPPKPIFISAMENRNPWSSDFRRLVLNFLLLGLFVFTLVI